MALSDKAKEKLRNEMQENRGKLMNVSAEERQKHFKEIFDRIQAEDQAPKREGNADSFSARPPGHFGAPADAPVRPNP
jgi:hypothetical protein